MNDKKVTQMPSESGGKKSKFDFDHLKKLSDFMVEQNLSEVEVEEGDSRVRLSRGLTSAPVVAAPSAPAPAAAVEAAPAPEAPKETLNAPMVGTFYRAPAPDKPVFVNEGDTVKEGQVIGVIEAMKTFNQIEAEKAGKIVKALVNDASPVEFGQPLFEIE